MASGLNVNPYTTTQASGLFATDSSGYVQGLALLDPATRYALATGYVDEGETQPLWGGIAVSEQVSLLPGAPGRRGQALKRATSAAEITGFSAFNQSHHLATTPNSTAPQAGPGNSLGFFRLGSGVRLPVLADPALLNLAGKDISASLSWDMDKQRLTTSAGSSAQGEASASSSATLPVKLLEIVQSNGLAASYDATSGNLSWVRLPDSATGSILALIQL